MIYNMGYIVIGLEQNCCKCLYIGKVHELLLWWGMEFVFPCGIRSTPILVFHLLIFNTSEHLLVRWSN